MPEHSEVAPALRASKPTPAAVVRCPRCGARTGALESTTQENDVVPVACDRYCGCCGLIVPIAR